MEYSVIDTKLQELIEACYKTKNYKKLVIVGLMLISNKIDELGIRLGLEPRNKEGGELIYEYMKTINKFLESNLKFILFEENLLNTTKRIEEDFKKNIDNISVKFIKVEFNAYYELRKIEVPNLYKSYNNFVLPRNQKFFSALNFCNNSIDNTESSKTKTMFKNSLEKEIKELQSKLKTKYDKDTFKKVLLLKSAQNSIEKEQKKIEYEGSLITNLNYQSSKPQLLGYLFVSIFILFFLLTAAIIIEAIFLPRASLALSFLILLFAIPCFVSLIIYWLNFNSKKGETN